MSSVLMSRLASASHCEAGTAVLSSVVAREMHPWPARARAIPTATGRVLHSWNLAAAVRPLSPRDPGRTGLDDAFGEQRIGFLLTFIAALRVVHSSGRA